MQKRINIKKVVLFVTLTLIALILLFYILTLITLILNRSVVESDQTDHASCGILYDRRDKRNKRIVNGQSAIIDSYPWVISLRLILNATSLTLSGHICGGCLVRIVFWRKKLIQAKCLSNFILGLNDKYFNSVALCQKPWCQCRKFSSNNWSK